MALVVAALFPAVVVVGAGNLGSGMPQARGRLSPPMGRRCVDSKQGGGGVPTFLHGGADVIDSAALDSKGHLPIYHFPGTTLSECSPGPLTPW